MAEKTLIGQGRFDESIENKKVKTDLRDHKIMAILAENSRTPMNKIAKAVKLSRDGVNYRIKRLEKLGVIKRFFPIINLESFGYKMFYVFMLLDELDQTKQKKLIDDLVAHPNTKAVREYSDTWDVELVFIAKTIIEMDEILMKITSKYPEVILEKEKMEVIKNYNSIYLPYKFYEGVERNFEWKDRKDFKKYRPDEKDLKIIEMLCKDCRTSTYKMAENINLSADAVSYRIKNLVDAGIIQKFTIMVDLTKLGFHWYTYAMQVKTFSKEYDNKMKEFVRQHDNIIGDIKTLGTWDFMFHILTYDAPHYHKTIKEIKTTFSDIVKDYETWVAYKEYFFDVFPRIVVDEEIKMTSSVD